MYKKQICDQLIIQGGILLKPFYFLLVLSCQQKLYDKVLEVHKTCLLHLLPTNH